MSKILAIDPSTRCIGWCVLDTRADAIRDYGAFKPRQDVGLDDKLKECHEWLAELMAESRRGYDVFAFELPVYHRNVKTLRTLAQFAGVLRLAARPWAEQTIEILPAERRLALGVPIAMSGARAKAHIRRLVNAIYGLELKADQHDIADAIAVAVAAQKRMIEMGLQS